MRGVSLAAIGPASCVAACAALAGLGAEYSAGSSDAGLESAASGEAGPNGDNARYFDLTSANFELVDLVKTSVLRAGSSYLGGAFDGRYVYFAPDSLADSTPQGVVMRYDTRAPFAERTSWSTYDLAQVDPGATGFASAVFDGRYVDFAPFHLATGHLLARYDTTTNQFADKSGWTLVDTTKNLPSAQGFRGAASDGRALYLAGVSSNVLRFDLDSRALALFNMNDLDASVAAFGMIFDGQYVTLVPYEWGPGQSGFAVRYNTSLAFSEVAAWAVGALPAPVTRNVGGVTDGAYVYLISQNDVSADGSTIYTGGGRVRRAKLGASLESSPWEQIDLFSMDQDWQAFTGGAFDGRFVYAVGNDGALVRYDTQAPFTRPEAWQGIKLQQAFDVPGGYLGAVFDGRWVYLVPAGSSYALRFHAREPARSRGAANWSP